jgi:hypothetical protein
MTDIVYILGRGSIFDNLELRYSLRSVQKFINGFSTVYVVGECPDWLTGAVHLPYPDRWKCKERNIKEKIELACHIPQVSEKFLHIHDDHFCLQPFHAEQVPYYAGSTLDEIARLIKPANNYRLSVINTFSELHKRGLKAYNFDVHTPIVYDKRLFLEAMSAYNWARPGGYVVKSLYANHARLEPVALSDVKIRHSQPLAAVVAQLSGRTWWSVGNSGLTDKVRGLLQELYPEKSRFEL